MDGGVGGDSWQQRWVAHSAAAFDGLESQAPIRTVQPVALNTCVPHSFRARHSALAPPLIVTSLRALTQTGADDDDGSRMARARREHSAKMGTTTTLIACTGRMMALLTCYLASRQMLLPSTVRQSLKYGPSERRRAHCGHTPNAHFVALPTTPRQGEYCMQARTTGCRWRRGQRVRAPPHLATSDCPRHPPLEPSNQRP